MILRGNGSTGIGNGTFASPVSYITGDRPVDLRKGDFNADGIIDLATANADSDTVSILLGNGVNGIGNGTFGGADNYTSGNQPAGLAIGFFNDDDILDIVATNELADNVSVLLGKGTGASANGTFATPSSVVAGTNLTSITTGDFNEDGIVDLATTDDFTQKVSIYLGNGVGTVGNGTYAPSVDYTVGVQPRCVRTGDFNEDGVVDLVTTNFGSNTISVLLGSGMGGNGDGTFFSSVSYSAGQLPYAVVTGDFNVDGITDLVVSNYEMPHVSVLLGNGSGGQGNGTFAPRFASSSGTGPRSVATADFNGDTILDLVTANRGSFDLTVKIGLGDGTFGGPTSFATGSDPAAVLTGDFNGDGITDIAASREGANVVTVLLGLGSGGIGNGNFGAPVNYAVGDRPLSFTTADFDQDGITDIVTANRESDDVSVLLGNGTGGIGDGTFAQRLNYLVGETPEWITTADLNGDGLQDVITANHGDLSVLNNLGFTLISATSAAIGWTGYQ